MKRIVITGASGLVGSHLLPLFGPETELHLVTRGEPDARPADARVHFHQIDLASDFDAGTLPKQADAIIYLAQSQHFRLFPERALHVFRVNSAAPLRLLDYARRCGAQHFIYASSGGVYGSGSNEIDEEASLAEPSQLGFYLSSKLCGEILAENFSPYMNVAILRLFFAYGRGQSRQMLIPRLIDNIRAGNLINLRGLDGIRINPIHAQDAALAVKQSMTLEGLTKLNVAGPQALSMREICEIIAGKVQREPVFAITPAQGPADLIAGISRMENLLFAPTRKLEDNLDDLL